MLLTQDVMNCTLRRREIIKGTRRKLNQVESMSRMVDAFECLMNSQQA